MNISNQTQFHTQAGGTAKAGEPSTAGQRQEAAKKTSASAGGIRDSFERTNAFNPRNSPFGSAPGLGAQTIPAMKNIGDVIDAQLPGSPGLPRLNGPPVPQKRELPEGELNNGPPRRRNQADQLTPDEVAVEVEQLEAAADIYMGADGNWNLPKMEHDILNIATARRLIDDLRLDGRDMHGFDPRRVFDRGDINRLENYADWMAGRMLGIPADEFQTAADLADTSDPSVMRYYYGEGGLGGGLDRGGQDQPAGAGIGPNPGQGATLTGLGGSGGGGGGGVGAPPRNSDGNTPGGFFGGGTSREPGSAHGHGPNPNRGGTPGGPGRPPADPDTPSTPSRPSSQGQAPKVDRDKDKDIKVHDTGGDPPTTKDTMAVVDKLIRSWDQPDSKSESGEGLPPGDETRHRDGRGSDVGPHRPERLRGVTQQEIDLVGPAIATKTGPDDKERPETGSTSGRPATGDLDDDIGGPGISSLRKGGGGEAGPLWKDLRVLNPIDPSKV